MNGEEAVSFLTVDDLVQISRWFCNAGEQEKAMRLRTFFNPAIAARSRLGQGMHDRGEAFAFAGAALEEGDHYGLSRHMPFHVKVVSVLTKVIKRDETWDVSVRGAVWGLDDMEELYVALNIGTLILAPGARLVVRGNVFSLLCQRVICMPGDGDSSAAYHIGILPTPFSVDFGYGPHDGAHGMAGRNGRNGNNGREAVVERTLLGYRLQAELDPAEMNGENGEDGGPGHNGAKGRNGGMAKLAELTFRQVEGRLTVFTQAGKGGDGGNGGNGGDGGNGGVGAPGHTLIRGLLPRGANGHGGKGGDGGKGGNGGNGGLSSNIYITVPEADMHKVTRTALPAEAGRGGAGGRGGRGGIGPDGISAAHGDPGSNGMPGRSRPAAVILLNGQV